MANEPTTTCPDWDLGFDNIPLLDSFQSNADVAGYGILVAFAVSAYSTFLLVVVHYLSGCDSEALNNRIDDAVISRTRKWPLLRDMSSSGTRWKDVLDKAVLMFSDQQLVTGLAILISAFSQLSSDPGTIDSYHWQLMVYLAWFASLTHLTTLTTLRHYFRSVPRTRQWRVGLMAFLLFMLIVALLPTGLRIWVLSGVPARCFFLQIGSNPYDVPPNQNLSMMLISILMLLSSYLARLLRLWKCASALSQHWLKDKPLEKMEKAISRSFGPPDNAVYPWYSSFKYHLLALSFTMLLSTLDLFTSLLWEIIWLLYALIWGSVHLFTTRTRFSQMPDLEKWLQDDNRFSFGQCIALLLLTLPLLSVLESYFEQRTRQPTLESITSSTNVLAPRAAPVSADADPRVNRMIRMGASFSSHALFGNSTQSWGLPIARTSYELQVTDHDAFQETLLDPSLQNEDAVETHAGQSPSPMLKKQSLDPERASHLRSNIMRPRILYCFEWFRLLVWQVLFIASIVFAYIMTFTILEVGLARGSDYDIDTLELIILKGLIYGSLILFAVPLAWAGTCICAFRYLRPYSPSIAHHLGIKQRHQQTMSRILCYLGYFALLIAGLCCSLRIVILPIIYG